MVKASGKWLDNFLEQTNKTCAYHMTQQSNSQVFILEQKSVNFFPKKPESEHKARGSGSHTISVTINQLGRCHGKAAMVNKHTRLGPSKALFVETGSRFGLQVLVCRLQSKRALFKGTFCSNEMVHRCSTHFCRHTGL